VDAAPSAFLFSRGGRVLTRWSLAPGHWSLRSGGSYGLRGGSARVRGALGMGGLAWATGARAIGVFPGAWGQDRRTRVGGIGDLTGGGTAVPKAPTFLAAFASSDLIPSEYISSQVS
jgi:hypothetical protein